MTHESILTLIDHVNAGSAPDRIFLRPLAPQVDFGWVWEGEPTGRAANEGSLRFYFVRDEHGRWVAAVEDLGHDLHAVTQPAHRRRGLMQRAMRDVVLPHIFSSGIVSQRVRTCSPEGRALSLKLGFVPISEDEAEIAADRVALWKSLSLPASALPLERLVAIDTRLGTATNCVRTARARLDGHACSTVLDRLDAAAYWLEVVMKPDLEWPADLPDAPQPTRPPLGPDQQKEVEGILYRGAGLLRMAADELDGRSDEEKVSRIRQLAGRLVDTTRSVRDDWKERQFLVSRKTRPAASGVCPDGVT